MNVMNKSYQFFGATAAAALLGFSAMPAQADLIWEVTIAGVPILVIADNTANDTNATANVIAVNVAVVNAALVTAGSDTLLPPRGQTAIAGTPPDV